MDLSLLFESSVQNSADYIEALDIVKHNSSGKIWLIGGFVYRTIAAQLYGSVRPEVDLDFIVEKPVTEFKLPPGWTVSQNRFNNPKFVSGTKQIDYVPLNNIHSIKHRSLEPTIVNFLTGSPLTVQAVIYDVDERRVVGDIGIDALKRKVVEVYDLEFARYAAQKKGKSLHAMISDIAKGLDFTPVFPKEK